MIMARSIILSLAVLHFGSALVTGQGTEITKDADFQVVRGEGKCADSHRIPTLANCTVAFRHFAEMHGYEYEGEIPPTGQGDALQCRGIVNDSTKKVSATYQVGRNAETHVACTKCEANRRMLGADATDYECKEHAAALAGNVGKSRCPIGQFYDSSACYEVTTICPAEFVPYVGADMKTECAYVGDLPTWKEDGGRTVHGDKALPAGYLLPKAGKVAASKKMANEDCYNLLVEGALAMKEWRAVPLRAQVALDFSAIAGGATGFCYAEISSGGEFKGGVSDTDLTGDQYPVMSGCGSECPVKDASEWKCAACATATEAAPGGRCPFGKVAAWKGAAKFDCMSEAQPVCEALYTPIIDAGVAKCYFGPRAWQPAPPCPDLHTSLYENGQWKCTRQTNAKCLVSDDNTCPDHYSFQKVADKWKCDPSEEGAVCVLESGVCPPLLPFSEEEKKCEKGANVIVANKEKIKCYLGKDLVEDTENGEWKCGKVDVDCPKGYKQNEANNKIECKAEGGNSGSVHATASFAAMISVVGAVLMRM